MDKEQRRLSCSRSEGAISAAAQCTLPENCANDRCGRSIPDHCRRTRYRILHRLVILFSSVLLLVIVS